MKYKKNVPISDAFAYAWSAYKLHWKKYIGFLLISIAFLGAIMIAPIIVGSFTFESVFNGTSETTILIIILLLLFSTLPLFFLGLYLMLGYIRFTLDILSSKQPTFSNFFKSNHPYWRFLATLLLVGLVSVAISFIEGILQSFMNLGQMVTSSMPFFGVLSMVLSIIGIAANIFISIRLGFAQFIIIDFPTSSSAAIKKSWQITHGVFWELLGLFILIYVLSLAGFLAFGIGLLVTTPISTLAMAYVYRSLLAQHTNNITTNPSAVPSQQSAEQHVTTEH